MIAGRHFFVDRSNHKKSMESLAKAKYSMEKNPRSIIIYPEGTRSFDGSILPFKKGGLIMAMNMGITVVPVAMCGTREAMKKGFKLSKYPLELRIGEPIETSKIKYEQRNEFVDEVRNSIIKLKSEWYIKNHQNNPNEKNHLFNNSLEAKSIIFDYKNKGKKVVFSNGCFDIIHKGHKTYLNAARELGDFLIIGLNSDSSVRELKGSNRPVIDQNNRANNLLKLDCVDAVTIFNEDTPEKLINDLSPDLIVKGGDYKPEEVIGADYVQSYGGEVIILPFVPGYSSTNIIMRMQGKDLTEGESSN